jgi:glycosyltransferase involved in cell wall biosynthesis
LFIGEGELMEQCKARVNNEGLSSRVNFLGYSDNIPELVHAADINVLTSLREGLPRVVVEACFCKVPTAAFDVEGLKEIITDGESGFIVPQGNTAALTSKIKLLIDAPELRTKFGDSGFEHVCRSWDAGIMVNELRELYLQSSK